MTKYCVAARIDERGKAVGGRAGDQSGSELNVHTLAGTGSWTYILRPPAKAVETMVKQAYAAAANNNIGYDQNQRTTLYTYAKAAKWNLANIKTACECDCSSLIAVLANCAGYAVSKDMYTGNEVAALTKVGFTKLSYAESKLQRGDVIWRKGHTEIYVGTSTKYSAPAKTTSSYSQRLVDISHHNASVDLKKVKSAGYHVIMKVGPVNGKIDPKFLSRAKECEKLGIPYGAYYYGYATSEAAGRNEAKQAIGWLKGRKLSYPVYYDAEEPGTQANSGKAARGFCNEIEKAGYWAGIYASESWWNSYLVKVVGDKYTKWVAKVKKADDGKPGTKPNVNRTDIWQYSWKGRVDGIGGYCDVNTVYRDLVKAITGKSTPAKKSVTDIAKEVIAGKWGNGEDRKKRLKAAGYDYDAVQRKVNELL